jgi:hypothetical protein
MQLKLSQQVRRVIGATLAAAALATGAVSARTAATTLKSTSRSSRRRAATCRIGSRGFLVDLKADFNVPLAQTGAGLSSPAPACAERGAAAGHGGDGPNDKFPQLVVLLSSTKAGAGINHANAFNIVAVTDQRADRAQIWSTWIIGAPNAFGTVGVDTPTRLFVAAVRGTAPAVVQDLNFDGQLDEKDLELMNFEVVSQARTVDFIIKG